MTAPALVCNAVFQLPPKPEYLDPNLAVLFGTYFGPNARQNPAAPWRAGAMSIVQLFWLTSQKGMVPRTLDGMKTTEYWRRVGFREGVTERLYPFFALNWNAQAAGGPNLQASQQQVDSMVADIYTYRNQTKFTDQQIACIVAAVEAESGKRSTFQASRAAAYTAMGDSEIAAKEAQGVDFQAGVLVPKTITQPDGSTATIVVPSNAIEVFHDGQSYWTTPDKEADLIKTLEARKSQTTGPGPISTQGSQPAGAGGSGGSTGESGSSSPLGSQTWLLVALGLAALFALSRKRGS